MARLEVRVLFEELAKRIRTIEPAGDQRIALFHQPRQVFVGRTDDAAQHPHRQFAGNGFGCVKSALGQNTVQNIDADGANIILKRGHDGF